MYAFRTGGMHVLLSPESLGQFTLPARFMMIEIECQLRNGRTGDGTSRVDPYLFVWHYIELLDPKPDAVQTV